MSTSDADLLAKLPPALANALKPKLTDNAARAGALEAALREIGYPAGKIWPLPAELNAEQLALATLASNHDVFIRELALPHPPEVFRRWSGATPAGPLEAPIASERDGKKADVPLWHALQRAIFSREEQDLAAGAAILNALPIAQRLEVYVDLFSCTLAAHDPYEIDADMLPQNGLRLVEDIGPDCGAWAARAAEAVLAREAAASTTDFVWRPHLQLRLPIFAALVRSRTLEPRFDTLLPIHLPRGMDVTLECIRAIPEERRTAAILAGLARGQFFNVQKDGLMLLSHFPSAELTRAILAGLGHTDRPKAYIAELKKLGKTHASIKAVVAEYLASQKPAVKLDCFAVVKPRSLVDLDETQREQLRICGERWDGNDLSADVRMADDEHAETSLRATLEIRTLGDDAPLYDAFMYAVDSGTIFEAGKTKVVAELVQDGIECEDPALKAGLAEAIRAKPKAAKANPTPTKVLPKPKRKR